MPRWAKAVAALILVACVVVVGRQVSRSETYQLFGDLISRVDTAEPVVALTFDDGPTARHTPAVLQALADSGITATFYVNGLPASKEQETLADIVKAGHEIGNHAWHHNRMVLRPPWRVRREIADTDNAIRAAGYDGPITFRPPYGAKLIVLPWVLSQMERATVMWDVAPEDWDHLDEPPADLAARTISATRPGSIIILHPMFDSGGATRAAIPLIVAGLQAKGYRFVTVGELLALGPDS
ncbi:MAG: polysaccharide deacetylase family protein [Pseudomonadota bacterium]